MATYQQAEVHIQGLVPTIMNNGQLSNPLNDFARAMKKITSSKTRGENLTDEQATELARLQFFGGLYVNEKGAPVWPGENIESMILAAAKKKKQGPKAATGIVVDGNFPLIYEGPKTAEKLWAAGDGFRKVCMVNRGGGGKKKIPVLSCRPIFYQWELVFVVSFDPDILDMDTLTEWIRIAGRVIGLSDWRPKFGRFELLGIKKV